MFENVQQPSFLTSSLDTVKRSRWQQDPLWLSAIRENGRIIFERMGLPNLRHEEWKYTDVSAISLHNFSPPAPPTRPLSESILKDTLFPYALSPLRLVFVNGFFSPSLSQVADLPQGIEAGSLRKAVSRNHPLLQKHLGAYVEPAENSFAALNNAFIEDGAFIYIPEGVRLNQPVHLVYIGLHEENTGPDRFHPRNLFIAGKGASVKIIEDYVGHGASHLYLNNPVTEMVLEEDAEMEHYKLQRESEDAFHIAVIQVLQEKGSRFTSDSVSFGAQLTRNNIDSHLTGTGASCTLNGLYMIRETRHVDNHTMIRHSAPHCRSSQVYHGILNDKARGVFNGKIYVHREAQKTDSQQTSRSLMLSNDSRVDAKPQLEIFADDVKCTHGATVGQIDADALYYLRSRGVSVEDARKMVTFAFGQQVTGRIKQEAVRKAVERLMADRLEEWNR